MTWYLFYQDENGNLHQVGHVNGDGLESEDIMQALWERIDAFLRDELGVAKVWYYNIWNSDGFTVIDFGSHTRFLKIRPVAPIGL